MGTWTFDPYHTQVEFSAKHLGMMTVRGHFAELTATGEIDVERPENSKIEATINVASIRTHNAQRDKDLLSSNFLEVDKHPTITFKSTKVTQQGKDDFSIAGDLTIRDVTRPIVLDVTKEGEGTDPWGNFRTAFSATTKLNRTDFGLTYNQVLETGGVVVGEDIKISVDVELTAVKN